MVKDVTFKQNNQVLRIEELPCKFLTADKSFVNVRAFTLGELKLLSSPTLSEEDKVKVYNEAVLNADLFKLAWQSTRFIMANVSLFTNPSTVWDLEVPCTECEKQILTKVSAKNYIEYDEIEYDEYPVTLEINKKKQLTIGAFTTEAHFVYEENYSQIKTHLRGLFKLSLQVLNMSTEDAFELLQSIDDGELINLIHIIESKLRMNEIPKTLKCPSCGHEDQYSVEPEVSTIVPFRRVDKLNYTRISFKQKLNQRTLSRNLDPRIFISE